MGPAFATDACLDRSMNRRISAGSRSTLLPIRTGVSLPAPMYARNVQGEIASMSAASMMLSSGSNVPLLHEKADSIIRLCKRMQYHTPRHKKLLGPPIPVAAAPKTGGAIWQKEAALHFGT